MCPKVSVIVTILNGDKWIQPCFESIAGQVGNGEAFELEVCVFDDASTDGTFEEVKAWEDRFGLHRIELLAIRSPFKAPKGVGFGRNEAIKVSSGSFLCFQDIDDVMMPSRILRQLEAAFICDTSTIIGSQFERVPRDSTVRFTSWANFLHPSKLSLQVYTSHGPTLIMPTWFCSREVYDSAGPFESGFGVPEDLIFFYRHLSRGGKLHRVEEKLLLYTYHENAATFSVKRDTIWDIRMAHLIANELSKPPWTEGFTIWNAGKQGRRFYRSLPGPLQQKVVALCDIDVKLIGGFYRHFDEKLRCETRHIPIIHFLQARPPLVICFKLDLSCGEFERNLASLELEEGKDYILFS